MCNDSTSQKIFFFVLFGKKKLCPKYTPKYWVHNMDIPHGENIP